MRIKKIILIIKDVIYISKLSNVKNKKRIILLSVVLSNLSVLFDILIITIFAGYFSNNNNPIQTFILKRIYLFPLIVLLRYIFIYFEKTSIYKLQLKVNENLKKYLIEDIYKKGNYSISDASYFLSQLTEHVSHFYGAFAYTVSSFIQVGIFLAYLIIYDIEVVIYFFSFAIFLIYPTYYFLKKGRFYTDKYYVLGQNILSDIQRVIDNLFLIKILKTKITEFENFNFKINEYTNSRFKNFSFSTLNYLIPNFTVIFLLSIILSIKSIVSSLTLEFLGIILRLVQTIGVINNNLNLLINSYVHLDKFHQIEKNKFIAESFQVVNSKNSEIAIKLSSLNFKYFGSDVDLFKNLNLEIYKNKHTIITGLNGTGKSTLLGILAGVFLPSQGKIEIFSKRIAYVGANPLIINGTLKENLTYGSINKINEYEMIKLLKKLKVFNNNEIKLQEKVTNKTLSSGQMQKIAFIRAFLSNPEILFLDESTANLDFESKKLLSEILTNKVMTIVNCTHNPEEFKYDKSILVKNDNGTSIVNYISNS